MNSTIRNERRETRASQPATEEVFLSPQVDIRETKDSYVIEAEMPGVNANGLSVLLEGNELTIVGRRQRDNDGAEIYYR
ncbi:MAG: Hsp20/alpha crystallin family protein, partial [Verrucomicrobia bacterium]|nr:Hsp20/alpha crystallin family protein [Verrucomicrobiota bacterium]